MRFDRVRGKGMGPFKGEFDLDLTKIEGRLVALVGENGAGKTTLLGLLPGALYRDVPTRGSLAELATARDSFVEVTAVNGARHVVRQLVDGLSKKGETLILDDAGAPVLASGKMKEADRWIAEHYPPPDLLYCSSFSVQGSRGIFDLTAGERKAVVNRALGTERFERMAEGARERGRAVKAELDTLRARLGDLEPPDVAFIDGMLTRQRKAVEEAEEATRGARVALDRAKAAADDVGRQAELVEQRRAAEKRLRAAEAQLAELDERLRNNRALLARADEIRTAVERAAELDAAAETGREASRVADQRSTVAAAAEFAAKVGYQRAADELHHAHGCVARLQARLKDRDSVRQAAEGLAKAREREAELESAVEGDLARNAELEQLVLSGKDQRIAGLRSGLEVIASGSMQDYEQDTAQEGLDADDKLAESLTAAPVELEQVRSRITNQQGLLRDVRRHVSDLQKLAARAGEIAQAEADLAQAQQEEASASARLAAAKQARDEASEQRAAANRAAEAAEAALASTRKERAALDQALALRQRLVEAEARIEELTANRVPAEAAVQGARDELATLPDVQPAKPVDLIAHEQGVLRAEAAEKAAQAAVVKTEGSLERARATLEQREALSTQITAAEAELADWTRLAQDLGKDGLQAMEIDAAFPELTEITNHLLVSTIGPRFTVEFRTDRLSADGKRSIEDFEIRVIDTQNGRDAVAETYSGGELVMIGTAVSLALTTLACRRYGGQEITLVRDESAAALDPGNARAYVAMLRLAAKQINCDRILLVSHSPEVQGLADARVRIADGRIHIEQGA